ncbi:EamA domain-containing protein [Entamoeba marina]
MSNTPHQFTKFIFPFLSGLSGCVGGLFTKGITSPSIPFADTHFAYVLRVVCIGLMLLFNSLGAFFFAKALNSMPSLTATITSTITSFIMSGIIGSFLGETIQIQWFMGMIILIGGVVLLIRDENETQQESNDSKEIEKKNK